MNRSLLPLALLAFALPTACQDSLSLAPDYVCEAVTLTPIPLGRTLVISHRGATAEYPENTREALLAAADQGLDSIELDVVLSSDGVPLVIHDYGGL